MAPQTSDLTALQSIQREVDHEIESRAGHWRLLQERLVSIFREYEAGPALSSAIYRVYTRADKQGVIQPINAHLKAAHKIAEEIYAYRTGAEKIRGGKAVRVKEDPAFGIYDVADIVGITIVCPFPSDVQRVVARIEEDGTRGRFKVIGNKKEHSRPEYAATHLSLAFEEDPLGMLTAEVQVKTAFQDAFSWKTHGLAYKADAGTDEWLIGQLNRINVVIRAADEMSDQLRDRISRENAHGRERRLQAKQSLKDNLVFEVPGG